MIEQIHILLESQPEYMLHEAILKKLAATKYKEILREVLAEDNLGKRGGGKKRAISEVYDEEEDDVDVNFEEELDSIPDAVTKDSVKKSKFDAIKSQASTSNDDDKTPSNVPNDVPIPASVLANNDLLIETKQGFQLRLPPGVAEKIVRTIDVTPHDGFKPVLELYASGKVQLHFEPK